MRTPSRRALTSPACLSVCRCAEAVVRFSPAAVASASTLRSPWASRSSSSSRLPLASALAVRASVSKSAAVLASAAGHRGFPHTALPDGEETDLGGLTLRALATPGHTDEHLSFLLLDGDRELGVFTGGSLIVGAAARTDLLGAERTDELA